MKLLRIAVLLAVMPVLAFGQRGGGGSRGGGGARSGGGGASAAEVAPESAVDGGANRRWRWRSAAVDRDCARRRACRWRRVPRKYDHPRRDPLSGTDSTAGATTTPVTIWASATAATRTAIRILTIRIRTIRTRSYYDSYYGAPYYDDGILWQCGITAPSRTRRLRRPRRLQPPTVINQTIGSEQPR